MPDQFSRTEMLIGKAALDALRRSRVAVFGLGGVGGIAAEALARAGVGALDLVDDDLVCITNINRQIYATHSTIGRHKADAAAERIADINPEAEIHVHKTFFSQESLPQFDFSSYDYAIDAIDTVSSKISLVMAAQQAGTPVISCMGAANKLDPTKFAVADIYKTKVCPLAKVMRRELRKRGVKSLKVVYSEEEPIRPSESDENSCRHSCACPPGTARCCTQKRQVPGSSPFVPPVAGLILAGEAVNHLCRPKGA